MGHILVVGGTSGIGLAATLKLVEKGHAVTVWARHAAAIDGATLVVNDVTSGLDVSSLPDALDSVIYCPGSINLKPFHRLTENDFNQDWAINVLGAVKTLQAVFPLLKKSEHASVVLFSTVAVSLGMPFHASIASVKGAIEGLTKSLAAEWAPSIRINAIAPSITQTPLVQKLLSNDEKVAAASKRHPLQTIGSAEDVAAMAVFLLSDEAKWITGQVMHLDGGLSNLRVL